MGDFFTEPSEAEKSDQTSQEQPKGIEKSRSVRFPSTLERNNSEEEKPERRVKTLSVGLHDTDKRASRTSWRTSRSSLNSYFQYLPEGGTLRAFSALIVLKMVFFDIAISFGDAVTDITQGIYLMFDFSDFTVKDLTFNYGVIVLVVCWLPGLVAIIHIMSHYRHEYFGLSDNVDDEVKKSRRNQFIMVILLCLTIYPMVPTISYLINIWFLGFSSSGNYNMKTARLEMFARVSHSISGCIEAPFQLILTSLLIMLGVLPVPWKEGISSNGITDGFQNEIPLTSIPMWTLIFSVMDILKCAVMINIFNVYVGQLRDMKTFKHYINLVGGHLPFFVHAICFRVLSFTFIILYLNLFAAGPIFLVWFFNIVIGYTATPSRKRMKKIVRPILKMHSIKRREAALPKVEKNKSSTPVWLNSFLSVVVPSCFMDLSDPAIINESEDKKFKNEVFQFNRNFQQKVIGRQIITSTLVILVSVGTICYLVNHPELTFHNYNRNIFYNNDFNIFCAVLGAMGVISLLFARNIDVFESLRLNDSGKVTEVKISYSTPPDEPDCERARVEVVTPIEGNPEDISITETKSYQHTRGIVKFLVCLSLTILVLSPVIAGYVFSFFTSEPTTYVVIKEANTSQVGFVMARARPLYLPGANSTNTVTGELKACTAYLNCAAPDLAKRILLIDLKNDDVAGRSCLEKVKTGKCPALKGVIILEPKEMENKTSRPSDHKITDASYPILSMNYRDARFLSTKLSDIDRHRQFTSILFNDIDGLLTEEESREEMFEVECDDQDCTSLKYPQTPNGEIYFGCDGSFKKASHVSIECRNYGLICPEVEAWKEKNQEEKFEKCFKAKEEYSKYGPVKCKTKKPKACSGEAEFWDISYTENFCKLKETDAKKYVAYSEGCSRKGEENYFKCRDDEEKLPGSWGESTTFTPNKDQPCKDKGKLDLGIIKLRFCRPSENCVIVEKSMTKCNDDPWEDGSFGDIKLCENI